MRWGLAPLIHLPGETSDRQLSRSRRPEVEDGPPGESKPSFIDTAQCGNAIERIALGSLLRSSELEVVIAVIDGDGGAAEEEAGGFGVGVRGHGVAGHFDVAAGHLGGSCEN
jgi:hypothetical protein